MEPTILPNEAANSAAHPPATPAGGAINYDGESDRDLMTRAQRGDRLAYGKLFERRAPAIWQMAYLLMHDADAAEDVVQETFTLGLQHLQSFRGESEPKSWFSSIAINECRQMLRKKRTDERHTGSLQLEQARPHGAPRRGVLTTLLRHETSRRLAVALGFLTEAQREVFVLHYIEGLPYEEIGELIGIRPGAARALSHRARLILQNKLKVDDDQGKSRAHRKPKARSL